uniref:C2H2-type domain-containing protein n=1 Tax=Musca domestica TaxID=7370 RepID=A0A1I8MP39_MUSDO
MELNDYNGFEDHCKANEMELLKRKYIHKEPHNNMDTIDHMMQRKDPEFMDHAGLLPPDHFIMDLMNFPKAVVSNGPHNGADALPPDLHFHNAQLFPVAAEDHHHHHSNEQRKSPTFLPLDSDFLMPVTKSYTTADGVGNVEVGGDKVVQELLLNGTGVSMDDGSIVDDDCDISRFDSRKVLPHKKRISRKLKINHSDVDDLQLNVPLEDHKLPQMVVSGAVQQFRCELCCHVTCSQLDFFSHLKQHYEPSTPDNILVAMKTSLDALGPEKSEAASNLCTIDKKTDGLDQVFQDVHFPFENFTQTDTVVDTDRRVVVDMNMQTHVERVVDMKVVYNTTYDNHPTQTLQQQQHQHHHQQQQQQQQHHHQSQVQVIQQQPQTHQQPSQNLVNSEEFSDPEDMLEGIRDKVLIEDTCDAMDLMAPNSNGVRPHWFNNNCFNGIDTKGKPFCDVLFSGQFAPMLNSEPTTVVPQDNHHMGVVVGKIMPKDLLEPTQQVLHHPTDLRLQFPETNDGMNNSHETPAPQPSIPVVPPPQQLAIPPPQQQQQPHIPHHTLGNNIDLIQSQHIKIENNNPDIPPAYQRENIQLVTHNVIDDQDYDNGNSDDFRSLSPNSNNENEHQAKGEGEETDDGSEFVAEGNGEDEDGESAEDGTTKRKRYVCNKCQRVFNSCNALKYHHRTHSGLRPHQCDICGKSFFAVGALKAHTRTHTGDKPFECEHCNRKFRQWGDLKYHTISIHSNLKNHQCEFCGKSFSRKYSLVVHLRIHTSERNYKCEFCTKSFRASTYLQNHRKIHTGEKPYECDICSKKFRVYGDLRRHLRVHERNQKQKENAVAKELNTPAPPNKTIITSPPTT